VRGNFLCIYNLKLIMCDDADERGSPSKLSAVELRQQGQSDASWVRYASCWRKFRVWLEANGHEDWVVSNADMKSALAVFESVKLPLSQVMLANYLCIYVTVAVRRTYSISMCRRCAKTKRGT
jgi:hypothetical protein